MNSSAMSAGTHAGAGYRVAPLALLAAGVCFYILRTTAWFTAVPGDLGDPRFNSVVLEHLFQWVRGDARSLWSPPFFYPARGTLAFSDNHFGSGLVYILFRFLGFGREGAFNGWFVTGCWLNFLAMHVMLRRLEFSSFAAAVGAFVYTFSLPALAQEGHAQLTYRFAIPMAFLALLQFASERRMLHLARLAAWGTLQFYCSIYLGVFMGYLLAATALAMLVPAFRALPARRKPDFAPRGLNWRALAAIALCVAATGYLLLKYHAISRGYGFTRSAAEVMVMLPTPQSYLLADSVPVYRWLGNAIPAMALRHEHQMFLGFVPLLLSFWALLMASGGRRRRLLGLSLATLILLVVLTLQVNGKSLYQLAMALPGVSSIRAVSRIVLVMVFPVAIMAAIGVESLERHRRVRWLISSLVVIAFSLETLAYQAGGTSFEQWRSRLSPLANAAGASTLKSDSVLYVSGRSNEPFYMTELDGMVFAQDRKIATLNGYSGNAPPGYVYPLPCNSAAVRIYSMAASVLASRQLTPDALLARTVWLPLEECAMPHLPTGAAAAVPDEVLARNIELSANASAGNQGELKIILRIRNNGAETLHSLSRIGHPLRLSWRMVQQSAEPASAAAGWDGRQDLNLSLPSGEEEEVTFIVRKPAVEGDYDLQLSMVAEGYKYLHELGTPLVHIPVVVGR